jgi:hypothetical protein
LTRDAAGSGRHQWTPDEMDRLERAIVEGDRVQISRRGTQFVVVPREVLPGETGDVLIATTYSGDELEFALDELEWFDVI